MTDPDPSATMRAAVARAAGAPDVISLEEVAMPSPGPGEVRVRVTACSLNPLDIQVRRGKAPWISSRYPVVLGIEHGGVVDAVGEGVDEAWVGQSVTVNHLGGNAAMSCVPVATIKAFPEGLDAAHAILYRGPCHTAYRIMELYGPAQASGQWVLVHSAAGTVGPLLTQLAKLRGLRVCGVVGSESKAAFASSFGLDAVVVASGDEWVEQVRQVTGSDRVTLAIDGNGGAAAARNLDVLAPYGTCVFIGAASGDAAGAIEPGRLIYTGASIAGFNLTQADLHFGDTARVDEAVLALLRAGTIRLPIAGEARLEDVPDLHRAFEARELSGRTIIRVGEG